MKKYSGLRLARTFCLTLAALISIFLVAGIGAAALPDLMAGQPYNWLQGLSILVFGGLLSLFLFALGQMIDVEINSYENSARNLQMSKKILTMLESQAKRQQASPQTVEEKVDEIDYQLAARKASLELDSDV